MIIAIPQLNYRTGDLRGNSEKIISAIRRAQKEKAELVLFPELAVCGAFPQDLLEREEFVNDCRMEVERIAAACTGIAAIVGAPNLDSESGIMYNSAYFIQNGEVVDGVHKNILSDYDVFNESRYFIAGEDNAPIHYKNQRIRILFDEYEAECIDKGDHFVVLMDTAPFSPEGREERQQAAAALSRKYGKSFLTVRHVGGCTSVLFEGGSAAYNFKGEKAAQLREFAEDFQIVDTDKLGKMPAIRTEKPERIALVHDALILGIRDYFRKNGFKQAVLGLSGGIDSAVVAALATEALGAENVTGLLMPSCYSTEHSVQDALELARNLGISHETVPIADVYEQCLNALRPLFQDRPFSVAEENLQARIRGMFVMAFSNKFGHIVLNTSNKSEAAVGYGTLYGDLCGSLGVIGDLFKTDVYALALHINRKNAVIPENILTKAPSAELHPGQKDQDTLPDYQELDGILRLYIEEDRAPETIVQAGYAAKTVEEVIRMTKRNEYKRAQCPPILKVSKKAFGQGRKYPY